MLPWRKKVGRRYLMNRTNLAKSRKRRSGTKLTGLKLHRPQHSAAISIVLPFFAAPQRTVTLAMAVLITPLLHHLALQPPFHTSPQTVMSTHAP